MRRRELNLPHLPADAPEWAFQLFQALHQNNDSVSANPVFQITVDGTTYYGVTDSLEIDGAKVSTSGSGVILNLNPYYALCRLSTAVTTLTTETKVTPLATSLSGFTVSSDILTCTNAGKYRLDMTAIFRTNTSGDVAEIGYRINGGTSIFPIVSGPNQTTYQTIKTTAYLTLAAADTVEFRVARQAGAGNIDLLNGSEFSLVQIA